ncbi:hypothetical protein DFH06DRAFT_1341013 [Mycena polygramma]|nr:hypothetical protein DFH06DRAFT_1341013 [Mycena polygramma]
MAGRDALLCPVCCARASVSRHHHQHLGFVVRSFTQPEPFSLKHSLDEIARSRKSHCAGQVQAQESLNLREPRSPTFKSYAPDCDASQRLQPIALRQSTFTPESPLPPRPPLDPARRLHHFHRPCGPSDSPPPSLTVILRQALDAVDVPARAHGLLAGTCRRSARPPHSALIPTVLLRRSHGASCSCAAATPCSCAMSSPYAARRARAGGTMCSPRFLQRTGSGMIRTSARAARADTTTCAPYNTTAIPKALLHGEDEEGEAEDLSLVLKCLGPCLPLVPPPISWRCVLTSAVVLTVRFPALLR